VLDEAAILLAQLRSKGARRGETPLSRKFAKKLPAATFSISIRLFRVSKTFSSKVMNGLTTSSSSQLFQGETMRLIKLLFHNQKLTRPLRVVDDDEKKKKKKHRGSASRPQNISRRLGTTRNLFACCEKIIRGIFRSKTEQRGLFATRCKRNGLIYIQRIENLGIDTQQTYKREKYTWELSLRDE
jgi:hypothetical protein